MWKSERKVSEKKKVDLKRGVISELWCHWKYEGNGLVKAVLREDKYLTSGAAGGMKGLVLVQAVLKE